MKIRDILLLRKLTCSGELGNNKLIKITQSFKVGSDNLKITFLKRK